LHALKAGEIGKTMVDITARQRLKLLAGAAALMTSACGGSSASAPIAPAADVPSMN